MKNEIQTWSGGVFDFNNPEDHLFSIYDIAHALSNICRFTGHSTSFYSVAQHSVLVSMIVPPSVALAGLLHDAAEAYMGDVAAPLKALLPEYKAIETRVERALLVHFGLNPVLDPIVKYADQRALVTEARDLMVRPIVIPNVQPTAYRITPLSPAEAAMVFIERFNELTVGLRTRVDLGLAVGGV